MPTSQCVIRKVICEVYLEGIGAPRLDIVFNKFLQKRVQDFELLDLFYGREITNLSGYCRVWSRTSLYRFLKSIVFIYADRISNYEYSKMGQML